MKQREVKIEIKVRAWHKKRKEMYQITTLALTEGLRHFGYDIRTGESAWLNAKDVVLLQYTGLKDKNGREIYNGDIVKFKPYDCLGYSEEFKKGLVELGATGDSDDYEHHKHYEWVVHYRLPNGNFLNDTLADVADGDYKGFECKIIGNIYENPELLKSNK